MLAECIDAVIGVDTHRDTHHAEIAHPSGAVIAACSIPSTSAGYAQLLAWASEHAPGPRLVISIEGTRSYGAGLARAAAAAGLMVTECEQPTRKTRRGKGKSDPIDAHLAVLAALQLDTAKLAIPRVDGDREALRIPLCARPSCPPPPPARPTGCAPCCATATTATWPAAASPAPPWPPWPAACPATPAAPRRYATARSGASCKRCETRPGAEGQQRRAGRHRQPPGPRPHQPARHRPGHRRQAIVSFSHPGRCRHDAAFARLVGTSPIEASSGQTTRHRLNRGGDRALNKAIHVIATTRMRSHPATRAYITRRRAQGTSDREIRRCLIGGLSVPRSGQPGRGSPVAPGDGHVAVPL
jgi:hypothetical protein